MTWSVDLCDGFVKVGEAEAFEFEGSLAELAPGYWTLTGAPSGLSAPDLGVVDSVIVWEDSEIRYAGVVRSVPDASARYERTVTSSGTAITWSGTDLFGLMGIRQCWPTPSSTPPWADSHDTRTGPASTVAAGYISANMGSTALAARAIADLTIIDPAIGTTGTWTRRLEPLDNTVADVCREGGISMVADMPTVGEIRFTFRSAADYRNRFVFSDQGDLEQIERLIVPATGSHIIAAGQGELTSRDFAVADSGATGIDRVESVYENTNILDSSTLLLAAAGQLTLQDDLVTVDATIADAALQRIQFGTDYQVGDVLGVEVDGVRHASPVTGVHFEINANRQRVRPVLGYAPSSDLAALLSDVTGLGQRFDRSIA